MAMVEKHGLEKAAIAFKAKVRNVEEKLVKNWLGGAGENAVFQDRSWGWFVSLEGSHESFHAGYTKPDIEVGDTAIIRISFYGRQ